MTPCKFTESAKRDLEDITEYTVKAWGKQQTLKYLDELQSKTIALSQNPNLGTERNNIYPNLLSFPVRKHIIYYLKQEEGVIIVRILHANMCHKLHTFSVWPFGNTTKAPLFGVLKSKAEIKGDIIEPIDEK
jgi:toxin ParE1/3/4